MDRDRHRFSPVSDMLSTIGGLARSIPEGLEGFLLALFPFHEAAWQSIARPIRALLNAPSTVEKDELTKLWKDGMQSQLAVVGVMAALLSTIVATAFLWPKADKAPWIVQGLWYSSLTLSLSAIATATQQAVALIRISCHAQGLADMRELLGKRTKAGPDDTVPRLLQIYIWQTPIAMLNAGIYIFLLSIIVFPGLNVWPLNDAANEGSDGKVLIISAIAFVWGISNYIVSTIYLYYGIRRINKPKGL